jgi:hypothetical protein
MNSKGVVEAAGVVLLDGPLTIPVDVTLNVTNTLATFGDISPTPATTRPLTIAGRFEITGNVNLIPKDDITITETAKIHLGYGTGSIDLKGDNKTLRISSSANFNVYEPALFLSTGVLKATGTTPTIIIDGDGGYQIDNTFGVPCGQFQDALADIKKTIGEVLQKTTDLEEVHFGSGYTAIGTVDLVRNLTASVPTNPAEPIVSSTNAGGEQYVVVPSDKVIVLSTNITGVGTPALSSFSLSINTDHQLCLKDGDDLNNGGTTSTGVDRFGVLEVTNYQVQRYNLISPPETSLKFRIGVKARRQ